MGLPSDADMGNSEVGHNALGSGQVVDQVGTGDFLVAVLRYCPVLMRSDVAGAKGGASGAVVLPLLRAALAVGWQLMAGGALHALVVRTSVRHGCW